MFAKMGEYLLGGRVSVVNRAKPSNVFDIQAGSISNQRVICQKGWSTGVWDSRLVISLHRAA